LREYLPGLNAGAPASLAAESRMAPRHENATITAAHLTFIMRIHDS